MRTIWESHRHREVQDRIAKLRPDTAAQWGRMRAPHMVVHLTDALKMASGALSAAPKRSPLRYPPLKQLAIYWLPIPKNLPTAPELIARAPGEWSKEVGQLRTRLDEFVRRGPDGAAPEHPAFGKMTGGLWGALVYRHMDHHLRQFGV